LDSTLDGEESILFFMQVIIQFDKMNDQINVLIFPFEIDCSSTNNDNCWQMENITLSNVNEAYPYMERASWLYKITFSLLGLTFTLLGLLLKSFIFGFLCSPSEVARFPFHQPLMCSFFE
jgi:hypothetical protein